MHGRNLHRIGKTIEMKNYDIMLDGWLLTADRAVYHKDTGVVDLQGQVHLKSGKNARSFLGEVR